jgi:hypothetical protein
LAYAQAAAGARQVMKAQEEKFFASFFQKRSSSLITYDPGVTG